MLAVKVGGEWLSGVRLVEELAPSTRWPGGCFEASWSIQTEYGWRDRILGAGATVEVYDGGFKIWSGVLDAPDWSSGDFTARGRSQQASSFPAFDGALNTTTTPSVAVTTAATQFGWAVGPDASVPTTPLLEGDATDGPNDLNTILDAAADMLGQRWAVDENGLLYFAADATDVDWHIIPGVVELGQTNSNYRSDLFIRYKRDPDNQLLTERVQWSDGGATRDRYGFASENIDLTGKPAMSTATAQQIGQGILTTCAPQPGWSTGMDLQHGEILTSGGEPAPLGLIKAGQVVRLRGVYDDMSYIGVAPYLDVVLGEVKWVDGSRVITLSPVDAVRDDLASVVEDIAGN